MNILLFHGDGISEPLIPRQPGAASGLGIWSSLRHCSGNSGLCMLIEIFHCLVAPDILNSAFPSQAGL